MKCILSAIVIEANPLRSKKTVAPRASYVGEVAAARLKTRALLDVMSLLLNSEVICYPAFVFRDALFIRLHKNT